MGEQPQPAPPAHRASGFSRFRARVRAVPGGWLLWRIGITIVGVAVIAVGIVLLPLPGPGWVIIFAGMGILATEYHWAAALLRRVRALLAGWSAWIAGRSWWVRAFLALVGLALLAAIGFAAWWFYIR